MSLTAAEDSSTFVNVETRLCLDSNREGKVYTLACNGGNNQNWTPSGERLINVSTQMCLDSNPEGKVYTLACNGGNYQNWVTSGQRLVNNATRKCLDSNAENSVYTLRCNGGNNQNWEDKQSINSERQTSDSRQQTSDSRRRSNDSRRQTNISHRQSSDSQRATDDLKQDERDADDPQQNRPSFRDWGGVWDMKFEFQGEWRPSRMTIRATDAGIQGSYDYGRLEGSFDPSDVLAVTGRIENTTGTGVTCSTGKQTGSFSLTLAVDGKSMAGWWDVCGAGRKYRWTAEKRSR